MVIVLCSTRMWSVFFPSPFYHCGEPHLFYNMLSLLWKGVQLETSMSSVEFTSMVATLLTMSQGITPSLAKSLLFFNYEQPYYSEYAVGFSGLLFSMKVVLNSQFESYTNMFGVIVPSHFNQMLVPGVTFLGHLGAILAGILHLHLKSTFSGRDPLAELIRGLSRGLTGIVSWPMRVLKNLFQWPQQRILGGGRFCWDMCP